MSNAILPLTGRSYTIKKKPAFFNLVQQTVSSDPVRINLRPYPQWELTADFKNLQDKPTANELNPILDFFLSRRANWDSFLVEDPKDRAVSGQILGVGDGSQKDWQLVRSFIPGGFLEPVRAVKTPPTPVIYLDDVPQESGWSLNYDTGLLTFTNAPGYGVEISGDYSYYWRVIFKESAAEFELFSYKLWNLNQITLLSVDR